MGLNVKTFAFVAGAIAVGVALGNLVAEPALMYVRGMFSKPAAAPAPAPAPVAQ